MVIMHTFKIGEVAVTWLGHASFLIEGERIIYVDPYVLPDNPKKADTVLVTHEHFDHCDRDKIRKLYAGNMFGPEDTVKKLGFGNQISAWKKSDLGGAIVTAVEAYNVNKFRAPGQPFHPKGLGVGYVIEINGKLIYHAGDTDNIPEMAQLKNIDLALLPIGGTYTMTPKEAAQAAETIKPKHVIPMHYNSDKYGVSGINANPLEFQMLLSKGVAVVLEPLV